MDAQAVQHCKYSKTALQARKGHASGCKCTLENILHLVAKQY